jgi:hypothetical protein
MLFNWFAFSNKIGTPIGMAFFAAQSTQNNHVEVKAVVPWLPTLLMTSPFVSTLKPENHSRVKPWRTYRPNWSRTRRLRGRRGQQKVSSLGIYAHAFLANTELRQCFRNPKPTNRGLCPFGLLLSFMNKLTAASLNKRANICSNTSLSNDFRCVP